MWESTQLPHKSKVEAVIPVLKFYGEWNEGPWCQFWTCLLSFLLLLLLLLCADPTHLSDEKFALILMESSDLGMLTKKSPYLKSSVENSRLLLLLD